MISFKKLGVVVFFSAVVFSTGFLFGQGVSERRHRKLIVDLFGNNGESTLVHLNYYATNMPPEYLRFRIAELAGSSSSQQVQIAAMTALSRYADREALLTISTQLESEDPDVAEVARRLVDNIERRIQSQETP